MKNQILILSACCLLFIVGSCTKFGKNITVEGNVINPINGNPYEGITIVLHKQNLKTIKTTITNANGHFEINASRLGEVLIRADNTNYQKNYNLGWDVDGKYYYSVKVDKGEVMHVDYHLVPYGKLHWHIKNVNCESATDSMWYKMKYQYGEDFIQSWNYAVPFIGCTDFSGNGTDKEQMGNHIIKMKIKRQSGTVIKYDTVFVNKDGITYYELFY